MVPSDEAAAQDALDGKHVEAAVSPGVSGGWQSFSLLRSLLLLVAVDESRGNGSVN